MLENLTQLHEAIICGLREKLPGLSVELYPTIERRIALPAVIVELSEMEPGSDPGTGETALVGRFSARAIVDPNDDDAYMKVRELAARIIVAITHETWGLPIGIAHPVQISEDGFKPELDGYLVWVVEWSHEFHLGEVFWPYPDDTGKTLMIGLFPETGKGKEDKYWEAGETPPGNWGEK